MRLGRHGFVVHSGLVALVVVLLLFVLMGWRAVFVVAGFAVVVTAGTWLYDRFTRSGPQGTVSSPPGREPNPADDYLTPDGRCRACGAVPFSVVPGQTTTEEIVAFATGAKGWKENPDARKGHMPPGLFCPNGCFSAIAQYPLPWPRVSGDRMARIEATFPDLYERAARECGDGDIYEWQRKLIMTFRKERRRFKATMPYRSRFHCPDCGKDLGEGERHYEDPQQTPTYEPPAYLWPGRPSGGYAQVKLSRLHATLVHHAVASPPLARLFEQVPEERG